MTNERIVVTLARARARRLRREARKTKDARYRTRLLIVLHYAEGWGCDWVAEALQISPATAARIARRFLALGEEGLVDRRVENGTPKVDVDLLAALAEILESAPTDHGWQRPTWTRELLARELARRTRVWVSRSTIARMLEQLGARWGMARPTVQGPWSRERKRRRWREIRRELAQLPAGEIAFFEDEVDLHLNPRIGRDWMLPGRQTIVVTPGKNEKRYLAGALSLDGTRLLFVSARRKNAALFIALLEKLRRECPRAPRIHLILDNYSIHSSRAVRRYLDERRGRLVLHFLAPYSPEHNRIERLWRELHANVTRNHRCRSMRHLLARALAYLRAEVCRRRFLTPLRWTLPHAA